MLTAWCKTVSTVGRACWFRPRLMGGRRGRSIRPFRLPRPNWRPRLPPRPIGARRRGICIPLTSPGGGAATPHTASRRLPVGVTAGIWTVAGDVPRRLDLVARWTGPDRPDYASINMNEPGTGDLADLLTSLGIQIEAGVWTASDARLLGAAAFRDRILRVLMEPVDRGPAAAVATAAEAASELARLGVTAPQVHHGYELATWDVMRAAVAMGQHIRVGLEDTTVLPDGSAAEGNADLVAAAVRLVRES